MASAFPLAQVALKATEAADMGAPNARDGRTDVPSLDDLPFLDVEGGSRTPASDGSSSPFGSDGSSSRPSADGLASPVRADASSSVLLQQVLGAAQLMGHDVAVPELPVAKLAASNPLRAAILSWIATTGSVVPPDELERELARADAMPLDLQRDVALLILSTIEASALQRAALAKLTPEQLEYIYTHPEIAEDLATGVDTPDTRALRILATLVDMEKSVEATLLLLHAVEATRGTFESAEAQRALAGLDTAQLDATTRAILDLVIRADNSASDADKVMMAAKLVSIASGVEVPAAGPAPSFSTALDALLAASAQQPSQDSLVATLARANALPDDLEGAIARIVLAEANAINAANPQFLTPTSQAEALVAVLVASAAAMPTLEKYALFWRDAPDAVRVGEWQPETRVGWAAHTAALATSTNGVPHDLARAAGMVQGGNAIPLPAVPERTFVEAFEALVGMHGATLDESARLQLADVADGLAPSVRDAAAILMSGAAESARLQDVAFAGLTPAEERFLKNDAVGLDTLYVSATLGDADRAKFARASALAERVDADALTASGVVAAIAMEQARDLLEGAGSFSTQGTATPVDTSFWAFLQRLLPIGSASAQEVDPCAPVEIVSGITIFGIAVCPEEDILLRITDIGLLEVATQFVPITTDLADQAVGQADNIAESAGADPVDTESSGSPEAWTCDDRECTMRPGGGLPSEATEELLVISGLQGTTHEPQLAPRVVCRAVRATMHQWTDPSFGGFQQFAFSPEPRMGPTGECRLEMKPRYGAPIVSLDLGGADTWVKPVAMVHNNATIPVSLHLDMGGSDAYPDPSRLYDTYSPMLRHLGYQNGHPNAGAAPFGGVAILADVSGSDIYFAATRSEGYGRVGLGMLADLGSEPDLYNAMFLSQGAASDTFTLGAGVLLDLGGADIYTTLTGQGYGIGGIFVDAGGADSYTNDREPNGAPLVKLDIIPGGDVTTLHVRDDNRVWLDGPGSLSPGIGVDTEIILSAGQSDNDGFADFAEFVAGTDPRNSSDSPLSRPTKRADLVLVDADTDGYPDYVERLLSTDPEDGASYPAGFPAGVKVTVPGVVMNLLRPQDLDEFLGIESGEIDPFSNEAVGTNGTMSGSDKIIDLRLPIQDAGSIQAACTGQYYQNTTVPILFRYERVNLDPVAAVAGRRDPDTNTPRPDADGSPMEQCISLGFAPEGDGNGTATAPAPAANAPADTQQNSTFHFHMPVGILAVGDVLATRYADDYFVIIDLGGADVLNGSAGGALPVTTRPSDQETDAGERARLNNTFLAPSVVLNLDLSAATAGVVTGGSGGDRYQNATRDYAHGSLYGVLVDNGGNDRYTARDGSQGVLGGVLLDLDGTDHYEAGNLSQGASLATQPTGRNVTDLPEGGRGGSDVAGGRAASAARRIAPGMLLDLGTHTTTQTFKARSHSQGFARGFPVVPQGSTDAVPAAYGILVSLEGDDQYTTLTGGRYTQGVGGGSGVGLLLDRSGVDSYVAKHRTSQGATISQTVATDDPKPDSQPRPAVGILVDLGSGNSKDTYRSDAGVRTNERHQKTTITRSESASQSATDRVYADIGLHIDTTLDANDPDAFVGGLGGSGSDSLGRTGFAVDLPTAGLAVGEATDTTYTNEYAFVVDLGGNNKFSYNAGGLISDPIAQRNSSAPPASTLGSTAMPLNLFPVTFLLDAGKGSSTYEVDHGLAQGAGFFGVGILADLGGRDKFHALNTPIESAASTWLDLTKRSAPIIDGTIGGDWEGIPTRTINLIAERDNAFVTPWTLRVTNDNRSIYVALNGTTTSNATTRIEDTLSVFLDMGRRGIEFDDATGRTGIDLVEFGFNTDAECQPKDKGRHTNQGWAEDAPTLQEQLAFKAGCRFTDAGEVFFEFRKDLVITEAPFSGLDLSYAWVDDTLGFDDDDMGIFVEFRDEGASWTDYGTLQDAARFRWPANAQAIDGDYNGERNNDLSDEMARWAGLGLAMGIPGKVHGTPPIVTLKPSLAQGVGIAGVGVLAMLGNGMAESELVAADRAQGFGAAGGLGLLLDAGGSDRYVGTERVQGAAQQRGLGILLDVEGNDNYVAERMAYGWTTAGDPAGGQAGAAFFFDLGGDDAYTARFTQGTTVTQARNVNAAGDGSVQTPTPWGNNAVWDQNATGFGADYRITSAIRETLGSSLSQTLHSLSHTNLTVTKFWGKGVEGAFPNGCSNELVSELTATVQRFQATGEVCLVASVDTRGNFLPDRVETPAAALDDTAQDQADLIRSIAADPSRSQIDVHSVDFLLDRQRIATALEPSKVVGETISIWSQKIDLGQFEDGVFRLKAIPTFVANITLPEEAADFDLSSLEPVNGRALLVYSLDPTNREIDGLATRGLVVDNKAKVALALEPEYLGIANATYSASGYGAAQSLYVNWSVSHDADEDRLDKANGFKAGTWNTSFPCEGIPEEDQPALCNQVAFYLLPRSGGALTTQPSDIPVATPDNIKIESIDAKEFESVTEFIRDDFRIHGKNSFHLALPDRTTLVPADLNTFVDVYLVDAEGVRVTNAAGGKWSLGRVTRSTSNEIVDADAILDGLSVPVETDPIFDRVTDTLSVLQGNLVWGAVNTSVAQSCAPGTNPLVCENLNGNVGNGTVRPCAATEPKNSIGIPNWLAWYAVRSVDDRRTYPAQTGPPADGRPFLGVVPGSWPVPATDIPVPATRKVCRPIVDDLNETAMQAPNDTGGALAPVANAANDLAGTIQETVDQAGCTAAPGSCGGGSEPETGAGFEDLNFTDVWFDATPPTDVPSSAFPGIRFESGHLVVPGARDVNGDGDYKDKALGEYGYTINLAFGLKSSASAEDSQGAPEALLRSGASTIDSTADAVNETDAIPEQGTGEGRPCPLASTCAGLRLEDLVIGQVKGFNLLDSLATTVGDQGALPAAFFSFQAGPSPDQQARLEIRVPAEPATDVKITLERPTGETVATVRGGGAVEGDVVGSPTRGGGTHDAAYWQARSSPQNPHPILTNWTAGPGDRWTQHNTSYAEVIPDGLYLVNISAMDNDRETYRVDSVLIDHTAPQTRVTTPPNLGAPSLLDGKIPIRWIATDIGPGSNPPPGSGMNVTYLFTRTNADGDLRDINTWVQRGPYTRGVTSFVLPRTASDTYLALTVGIDHAKNVEGSANQPTLQEALNASFLAKVDAGVNDRGYQRIFVDLTLPVWKSVKIDGGRVRPFEGQDFIFARGGDPISFAICVNDGESGMANGRVDLQLDHIPPGTNEPVSKLRTATDVGACEGGRLYAYAGWGAENRDASEFPQGVWSALFSVYDAAGNRIRVPAGSLILDHASPTVTLQAPVLPPGQTAVKPGDQVKIRFLATDGFGVEESGIRVDASALVKNGSDLKARPVRVNGIIYQETTFTVDRTDLTASGYDVIVKVPDLAGNTTIAKVRIAVNMKAFDFVAGSFRVTDVTHNSAILRWNTTEPTSALVKFGTSTIALNGRTPLDTNATNAHAVKIEGLLPSTRYHLRAVSASTGGFTKESDIVEVETKSALFLKPLSPVAGDKVSGSVKIAFQGGLLDSADFVTYTLEVRDSATKPWTFVTKATRQGVAHDLSWNSTRFLDGPGYEFRLTAEAGRDSANLTIGPVTSDNTAPGVLVLSPLLATNDTTPRLVAEASDVLSGITAATLLIDGAPVVGELSTDALDDGRMRFSYDVPSALAAGMRAFELRVQDAAGNVAKEQWKVAIDGDAPEIRVNPTRFAPGTGAARTAGTVTLNLTISDLSGVSQAVADTSALSTLEPSVRLVRLVGSDVWQGTFGVTAAEPVATKVVTIRAVDLAGNERALAIDIPLDNVAPTVGATSVDSVTHTRATILVPADEPILVTGTASSPASPTVTISTTTATKDAKLVFDGLFPSRTYSFRLVVTDRAGNAVPLAGSFATLVDAVPPGELGAVSVRDLLNGTLSLSWDETTDDVGVAFYRVYRSEDNGITYRVVAEVQAATHDDAGLPYEKAYTYKVAAVDHGANEGISSKPLRAAAQAVPSLTQGAVSPTVGTVSTTFRYSITYQSPGGVTPAHVHVILDGVPQNMTLESGDALTGAVYVYETRLAPHKRDAPHTYSYEVSDGRFTVLFPADGSSLRGPLVSGDASAASSAAGLASFAQKVPLGGGALVAIGVVLAVGLASLMTRKKKEGSK